MSEVKTKLELALKNAMKTGDDLAKRTFRLAVASIKNAEIEKREELDDAAIISILQKEIKMRRESIEGAKAANREDIIAQNEAEIKLLETLLPGQLSEDELKILVKNTVAELGVTSPSQMGQVIKEVMVKAQGRAANNDISRVVKEILSS